MIDREDKDNVIRYIIEFLLGKENIRMKDTLLYLNKKDAFNKKETGKIIIIESAFFSNYGSKNSLPTLPLKKINDIPFMYGESNVEYCNGNIILFADFIASAYIMLSRYEEIINVDKHDIHGRYPGTQSILYKSGNLQTPLIEEYSKFILNQLSSLGYKIHLIQPGFNTICFSHDVDIPWRKFNFISASKALAKAIIKNFKPVIYPYLNWLGFYKVNPYDTFEYMFEKERKVCSMNHEKYYTVCFILANKKNGRYNTSYILDKKTDGLIDQIQKSGSKIGMHTSYQAAENHKEIKEEKNTLETVIGKEVVLNRNHYLRQLSPMDMEHYIAVGIKADYTAGYPECPGFRLGTCRVAKWINPQTCKLTELNIHPLNIMEGSLDGAKPYQMGLSYEAAQECCRNIIDSVYKYNGDLCILWHNSSFIPSRNNYQKKLYEDVLSYIKMKAETACAGAEGR